MSNQKFLSLVVLSGFTAFASQLNAQNVRGESRLVAIANTVVAAESPGIIREIVVQPGAVVAKDEKLIQLNDEMFTAEYDVATADYEIAKLDARNRVNLEFADKSAEVAAAVLNKSVQANKIFSKSIPDAEIQQLRLEFEKSRLSGEQARLELDMAQWTETLKKRTAQAAQVRLDGRVVLAPFAGKIAQIYVQPGQWVNAGEPIVRLVDSTRLRAEAYLHEDLIKQVGIGQNVYFEYTLADEKSRVPAKITFVGVEIVEGIFQVWAEFENAKDQHLPGTEGVLVIPETVENSQLKP